VAPPRPRPSLTALLGHPEARLREAAARALVQIRDS
jgi:HEAT repeat protein